MSMWGIGAAGPGLKHAEQETGMSDQAGTVNGLSDKQAVEALLARGISEYRAKSAVTEARQAASVTLEHHLLTLMHDGFRIEELQSAEQAELLAKLTTAPEAAAPDDAEQAELLASLDAESRRSEEHARAVEELARTFQAFIDSPEALDAERNAEFTIDGAAYYRITPAQRRELMALAPDDIIALNNPDPVIPPEQDRAWPGEDRKHIEPFPPGAELAPDDAGLAIPPEQDRAWRDMAALGQELQGEPPAGDVYGGMITQAPDDAHWPAGLHEAHCGPRSERDDRCGPDGELCGCPCHRGEPVPPIASGLAGDEAVAKLVILGYDEEQANHYVADALAHGMSALPRDHAVWHATTHPGSRPEGTFAIYTKVPVPGHPGHFRAGPPQVFTNVVTQEPASPGVWHWDVQAERRAEAREAREIPGLAAQLADAVTENWGAPLSAHGAETRLFALGYDAELSRLAIRVAGEVEASLHRGGWFSLKDHQVTTQNGTYYVRPLSPPETVSPQLAWILGALEAVDAHLDEAGPQWAKDCPEANMQRRVGKAQLEAAEAMEELSLLTGENPRKGQHPEARDRMLAELGDTAVAALLGIQSQVKDTGVTWAIFLAALAKAGSRVPAVTAEDCEYGCMPLDHGEEG
jgi:hypothetical protein